MTGLWIVLGVLAAVIVLVLLFVWSIYNSLVRLNERVNEAWSDITVQLKYRADLIPNLVETVKGYAAHESEVFQNVSAARAGLLSAGDNVKAAAEAENVMTQALGKLFAVAEAYPELKANTNFLELQSQLTDTEDKISFARQFYNDTVQKFNTKIELFPFNLIAGFLGFEMVSYYSLGPSSSERDSLKINF